MKYLFSPLWDGWFVNVIQDFNKLSTNQRNWMILKFKIILLLLSYYCYVICSSLFSVLESVIILFTVFITIKKINKPDYRCMLFDR